MAKKKSENSKNYLDFIPVISDKNTWNSDEEGNVTVFVENKGFFKKLTQILLHKPKVSQIHLEKFGSFLFPLIDGKKSIYDIGQEVHEHFGDEAEPLYPRLTQYMKMLNEYGFTDYIE